MKSISVMLSMIGILDFILFIIFVPYFNEGEWLKAVELLLISIFCEVTAIYFKQN